MSTILVVDDMALCREPIAEALRQQGYDTICAADGSEALSILREQHPDLVLLDVNMPELNGLAVLRTMRRNPDLKQIPVVLLTDRAEKDIVMQAAERGVQGYILKSQFSLDELLARVEGCLGPVPITLAAKGVAAPMEASDRYTQWRSTIEKTPDATREVARPRKGAPAAKKGKASPDLKASSGQAIAQATVRSINDLSPVITKDDLIRLVNEGLALRPLGPTVHNVIAVTGNAGCCIDDLAKAVSHDQALCIRLLKLANSSAYSRGHLVDSVKEAIQRMGVQEIRSLVMTLGVFEEFEGAAAKHVDRHLFWEHSIACGLAASSLAEAHQSKSADDYFLWGMLHDVGRLILLEHASNQYSGVWDAAEMLDLPLEAVEAKIMLLDHCDILERALEHWQFPRDFIAPVVNHHHSVPQIKRLGPAHSKVAATVALANRITHALLIGSSGNDVIYPMDDLVELLGLPPATIAEIVKLLPEETNSLKYTMLARSNQDAWPDFASQVKLRFGAEFRPLCVSSESEIDAYRIFCERIASASDDEPHNLGVIYLRDANEFLRLTAKYDAAEELQNAANTPVVLIVAKGKLDTNDPWLSARHHVVLGTPVRISSFVAAVQQLLS